MACYRPRDPTRAPVAVVPRVPMPAPAAALPRAPTRACLPGTVLTPASLVLPLVTLAQIRHLCLLGLRRGTGLQSESAK